jgi:hypothetical protein
MLYIQEHLLVSSTTEDFILNVIWYDKKYLPCVQYWLKSTHILALGELFPHILLKYPFKMCIFTLEKLNVNIKDKIEKENKIYSTLIPITLHNPSYRINRAICYIKYLHINEGGQIINVKKWERKTKTMSLWNFSTTSSSSTSTSSLNMQFKIKQQRQEHIKEYTNNNEEVSY